MRVVYSTPMLDRIAVVLEKAKLVGCTIKELQLTSEEISQMDRELGYSGIGIPISIDPEFVCIYMGIKIVHQVKT